jgi:hypothetical protein
MQLPRVRQVLCNRILIRREVVYSLDNSFVVRYYILEVLTSPHVLYIRVTHGPSSVI